MSELTELAHKLTVYHDTLRNINQEVEHAVNINNLEAVFEGAFNFDALVYVAKENGWNKDSSREPNCVQRRSNLGNAGRIRQAIRKMTKLQMQFPVMEQKKDESWHTMKLDFQDAMLMESTNDLGINDLTLKISKEKSSSSEKQCLQIMAKTSLKEKLFKDRGPRRTCSWLATVEKQ